MEPRNLTGVYAMDRDASEIFDEESPLCAVVELDCASLKPGFISGDFEVLTGRTRAELIDSASAAESAEKLLAAFLFPADKRTEFMSHIKCREEFTESFTLKRADGNSVSVRLNAVCGYSDGAPSDSMLLVYTDVTGVQRRRRFDDAQRERLQLLLDTTKDIVFDYSVADDFIHFDDKYFLELGKPREWFINGYIGRGVMAKTVHEDSLQDMYRLLSGDAPSEFELRMRETGENAQFRWYLVKSTVIRNESGAATEVVGIMQDIQSAKQAELELIRNSKCDPLTGVLNGICMESEFLRRVTDCPDICGAMLAVDIDGFAKINEQMGYAYANAMLRNLAEKLVSLFGKNSLVGRIGADEFLVFTCIESHTELNTKCDRLCSGFSRFHRTVRNKKSFTLSVGIGYMPGQSFRSLEEKALAACACVKEDGGDGYRAFDDEMLPRLSTLSGGRKKIEAYMPDNYVPDDTATEAFRLLVSAKDTFAAINMILGMLGERYNLSRAYICEYNDEKTVTSRTFEWCADGIAPCAPTYQEYAISRYSGYNAIFDTRGAFRCNDTEALRDTFPELSRCMNAFDVKATLIFKINDGGESKGMIGFEECTTVREWTNNEYRTLLNMTNIIGAYVLKLHSEKQKESEQRLSRSLIDRMDLFVYSVNPETYTLNYVINSPRGTKGLIPTGSVCYKTLRNCDKPCDDCPMQGLIDGKTSYSTRMHDEDNDRFLDITAVKTTEMDGSQSVTFSTHDVTKYVRKLSDTDSLTCAPTFSTFERNAREILNNNRYNKYRMLYVDIIKFKYINETYGYAIGNRVLITVANVIQRMMHENECFGRIGSDRFAVLKLYDEHSVNQRASMDYMNLFRTRVIDALDFVVSPHHINFIVGIYDVPDNSLDISDIVDKAHAARKSVKQTRTSFCIAYDRTMAEREKRSTFIESNMEVALATGEFKVYLQPKFSIKTKHLTGAEALIRWIMPDGTMLFPSEFIPLFEQNGFIAQLDFFVYEEVCRMLRRWLDSGVKPVTVSVNVSRAHINNEEFIDELVRLTDAYGIEPSMLELELTESLFLENVEHMIEMMHHLHELGFGISIDDFGSGYSSLNLLKDLIIDVLKIDKSFFSGKLDGSEKALISGIISIAKNLNLKVICEGVETEAQDDFLDSIDCDYAQGYLYAKPMPITEFERSYCS